jgi:hypothetical protein
MRPPINGLSKHERDKLLMQIVFPYSELWLWIPADVAMVEGGAQLGTSHVRNICTN